MALNPSCAHSFHSRFYLELPDLPPAIWNASFFANFEGIVAAACCAVLTELPRGDVVVGTAFVNLKCGCVCCKQLNVVEDAECQSDESDLENERCSRLPRTQKSSIQNLRGV